MMLSQEKPINVLSGMGAKVSQHFPLEFGAEFTSVKRGF